MISLADMIINVLKKGTRDQKSKGVSFASISFLFTLLEQFAADRNVYAPILYKALTFAVVDLYFNIGLRQELLKHFIHLFNLYKNMPINILCEPLIK